MNKPLLIIDCPALCHRAKHAMREVDLSHEEMKTEIIFNFLNQIVGLANRFETNAFAFAWDSRKSYRRTLYPEYKYKRREEKTLEEKAFDGMAYSQFRRLRSEVLPALGFKNNFIQTGLEADDIMASLSIWSIEPSHKYIISRDNDLWQSINTKTSQFDFQTKKMLTRDRFLKENNNLHPTFWKQIKAIAGCSTDNVRGVDGVGVKTAIKYLCRELPEHHKTFQAIESRRGQRIIKRNKELVFLPFKGTKKYIYKKDKLHSKDFYDTFEQLNFQSFTGAESFREWEGAFQL